MYRSFPIMYYLARKYDERCAPKIHQASSDDSCANYNYESYDDEGSDDKQDNMDKNDDDEESDKKDDL